MRRALASLVLLLALAASARAHPLMPAALTLREQQTGHYEVTFRRPEPLAAALAAAFPIDCTRHEGTRTQEADQSVDSFVLRCARGLEGRALRVDGLAAVELSAMIYVRSARGEEIRALLSPAQSRFVVPARATPFRVFGDYVALGVAHLAGGLDHVLFVTGLLLLVAGLRAQLLALTAFTLGHSITLCLAALSIVRLPQAPVEIAIAASLLVLALEILRARDPAVRLGRRPLLLAGSFGLLHGLGFASALGETGLPPHAVALSLLGFNLGVELGQLGVVLLLTPLLLALRRASHARLPRVAAAYALGSLAAMWCIERAL